LCLCVNSYFLFLNFLNFIFMARMKRPVGDLVSGKIGNVVFFTRKDSSFVRAAPKRKETQWTPEQQLHRQRFSQAVGLWRVLKNGMVPQIWNLGSQQMNGYALFLKANMPAFGVDGTLLDPKLLQLSVGKLTLPQKLKAQKAAGEGTGVEVSWQNDPLLSAARLQDELMAVSSVDGQYSEVKATGIKREAKGGTFELPAFPMAPAPGPLHLYLFFGSEKRNGFTGSVCFELG
jgi:hypothetical protein